MGVYKVLGCWGITSVQKNVQYDNTGSLISYATANMIQCFMKSNFANKTDSLACTTHVYFKTP